MADPEKTIRDSIRHTLDGWPAGPFTHAEDCKGCRITAALDQLVALLAEKDAEIERKDVVLHLCRGHLRELRMDTPEDDALVKKIKNLVDDTLVEAPYPPPTRLDRRTRETLEAAGRAMSDAEEYLRDFRYARGAIATAQVTKLQDARRQIVHLLAEDEGETTAGEVHAHIERGELESAACAAYQIEEERDRAEARADALAQRLKDLSLRAHFTTCHFYITSYGGTKQPCTCGLAELLTPAEAVPPTGEESRCTGICIFDGDALTHPDLCCPIHGVEAQAKAEAERLDRMEWMKACRASWPLAPAAVPSEQPTGKGYTAEEAETAAANNVSINELRAHRKRHAPSAVPTEQPR